MATRIDPPVARNHLHQVVLIGSAVLGSWLGMQAIHESGHVAAAMLTGGRVSQVVLHPLTISRTDFAVNPRPFVTAWAGPIVGVVAPLLLWMLAVGVRLSAAFVLRFFAGFCLIANGLYLGVGSFGGIGDCGDLLRHGAELWQLWLFGALTVPAGLWLWHGQGSHFGLGPDRRPVSGRVAISTLVALLILLVFAFAVGDG